MLIVVGGRNEQVVVRWPV